MITTKKEGRTPQGWHVTQTNGSSLRRHLNLDSSVVFCVFCGWCARGQANALHCRMSLRMGTNCRDAQEKARGKGLCCGFDLSLPISPSVLRCQKGSASCGGKATWEQPCRDLGKVRAWSIYCVQNHLAKSVGPGFQEICRVCSDQRGNPGSQLPQAPWINSQTQRQRAFLDKRI